MILHKYDCIVIFIVTLEMNINITKRITKKGVKVVVSLKCRACIFRPCTLFAMRLNVEYVCNQIKRW